MDQKSNEIESFSELFAKSKAIIQAARDITGRVANLTTVISNLKLGVILLRKSKKEKNERDMGKRF